jgi:hypothetical protein
MADTVVRVHETNENGSEQLLDWRWTYDEVAKQHFREYHLITSVLLWMDRRGIKYPTTTVEYDNGGNQVFHLRFETDLDATMFKMRYAQFGADTFLATDFIDDWLKAT